MLYIERLIVGWFTVTLEKFVAYAVVASGSAGSLQQGRALAAFDTFCNDASLGQKVFAVAAARDRLVELKISGQFADRIYEAIDMFLASNSTNI